MRHKLWSGSAFAATVAMLELALQVHGNTQTNTLYLTAGDQRTSFSVSNGAIVNQWQQANTNEYAIAVQNDIRTMGNFNPLQGAQYSLSGVDLGGRYAYPTGVTSIYDGTTDGQYNYGLDSSSGNVYRFSRDWQNATLLFHDSAPAARLGITYDITNNSIWTSGWGESTIKDFAMDGTLLNSFNTGHNTNGALSFDQSDDTLWLIDRSQAGSGHFQHYSRTGLLLGTVTVSALNGYNVLGGEFAFQPAAVTPEGDSLLLVCSGLVPLAGLGLWHRRRRRQE